MRSCPKVSVVMGVYNGAAHLSATIESILSQEGINFEFIIVNDGSTDETFNILEEYRNNDQRIKVFHQENQGLTKALIKGCAEAKGEYIARQDCGDISLPNRLALQKTALDADPEISLVSCWTECFGPEWEFLYLTKGTGSATTPMRIISEKAKDGVLDGPTHHGSVVFRTNTYVTAGGYRADFYYGQDWDLWYRLAEIGNVQIIDKVLYKARVFPDSISTVNKIKQETLATLSHTALLRRIHGLSDKDVLIEASKIKPGKRKQNSLMRCEQGFYFVGECLRKNHDKRASHYFWKAVKKNPFSLRSWVRLSQSKFILASERLDQ